MKPKVLFVDDEPNLLASIKRQLGARFDVTVASDPRVALQLAGDACPPFAVVVSDLRMPGIDGVDLLQQMREISPDSARVMLTGQADLADSIAAVNRGELFRFLTKPCLPAQLVRCIEDGVRHHELIVGERELLQRTLFGATQVITDLLAMVNPIAFSQSSRLRRIVAQLAAELVLPERWRFELAALLRNLACVTLPAELIAKVEAGKELSSNEADAVAAVAGRSAALVGGIPRLELVAEIIAAAELPAETLSSRLANSEDVVALGGLLLQLAICFDREQLQARTREQALASVRQQCRRRVPEHLLAALTSATADLPATVSIVPVRGLAPGMVLDEDLRASSGTLLLARGHEVSTGLLEHVLAWARAGRVPETVRVLVNVTDNELIARA